MQTPSQILAARVVAKLLETGKTLATAESCTGGLIAARITDVPGCSSVFFGGCVTYTNEIKEALLGVDPATIAAHTEISAETAREMAKGARKRLGTDLAVSTTGIAGPNGSAPISPFRPPASPARAAVHPSTRSAPFTSRFQRKQTRKHGGST